MGDERQTDAEIMAELEDLFGSFSDNEEEANNGDENTDNDSGSEEDQEDTGNPEDGETGSEEDVNDGDGKDAKSNIQSKRQAEIFYNMRQEQKAHKDFIQTLGKALGIDSKADEKTIMSTIQDMIIQKEAKDNNIPVELLEKINRLENALQATESEKYENQIQEDLAALGEKFDLDQSAMEEFLFALADNGKNPLEVKGIDLEAEYLKMHYEDLINKAKDDAIKSEEQRKKKIKDSGSSGTPSKKGSKSGDDEKREIKTVKDLDAFFDSLG